MPPKALGEISRVCCSEGPYGGAVEAASVQEIGDAAVREGPPQLLRLVHLQLTLAASPSTASPAASFRAIAAGRVGGCFWTLCALRGSRVGEEGLMRSGFQEQEGWEGFQRQREGAPGSEVGEWGQPARHACSHR